MSQSVTITYKTETLHTVTIPAENGTHYNEENQQFTYPDDTTVNWTDFIGDEQPHTSEETETTIEHVEIIHHDDECCVPTKSSLTPKDPHDR